MKAQYDSDLLKQLKKINVRIQKSFKKQIFIFTKDAQSPKLRNHALQDKWEGYRSIDITADYRAIYKEIIEEASVIAYFVAIGAHKELYGN